MMCETCRFGIACQKEEEVAFCNKIKMIVKEVISCVKWERSSLKGKNLIEGYSGKTK